MAIQRTIFTRFLKVLGVPHTVEFSENAFKTMDFDSLYGMTHLLKSYGIPSDALSVGDRSELPKITPPFLAQLNCGYFVIVKSIGGGKVEYDSLGEMHTMPERDFEAQWNGVVLIAYPQPDSREPEYGQHLLTETVKRWSWLALAVSALAVIAYFFVTRRVYETPWAVVTMALDGVGLFFSYLLVQKTLGVHTKTGDSVCSVIQKGGCDSILSMKVSKLFGVFSWSVVGFSYFGVSLITLLVFPHLWPALALFNICCLPYSFWSVWYQHYRAHHWCTLCLGVQATLWLLFGAYTAGGFIRHLLPMRLDDWVLLATYVATVLLLNLIITFFQNLRLHAPQDT
ncbi:MAG: hypothetical protein K2O24_07995 [Muribaculaceae bacterium]|nr:hypothetical protein [Muribaculaceae bacterium]